MLSTPISTNVAPYHMLIIIIIIISIISIIIRPIIALSHYMKAERTAGCRV